MSENDLIKERFNLIIDHFSTIELDQCIGSVFLQSSIRTISKSYPPFGGIAYLYSTLTSQKDRAQRAAIAREESYWKLNDPIAVGGPLSINDTIPIIDKFIDLDREIFTNKLPLIFDSVVVTVNLPYHDVRYKQYLYDLSLSIRNQIGMEFSIPPTIPHFEDNFTVGFSLVSKDELFSLSNSVINILKEIEEEEWKADQKKIDEEDQKKIDAMHRLGAQINQNEGILLRDQSQMVSFTNPFENGNITLSGDSNKSVLVSNKKRGSFFKWLFSSASSRRSW